MAGADHHSSGVVTLQSLQEAQRRCTRCVDAGCIAASKPVFSGHSGQRILLVGQAPGPVENDCTRPFAGRAGRQLMRWFGRGGFASEADVRTRVYMTSMTTCFPGRTPDGRGDRRPSSQEVALCSGWLDTVLALLAPRLVMPIGSLALARFLPGHRLDDAVGRLFDASGGAVEDATRGADEDFSGDAVEDATGGADEDSSGSAVEDPSGGATRRGGRSDRPSRGLFRRSRCFSRCPTPPGRAAGSTTPRASANWRTPSRDCPI